MKTYFGTRKDTGNIVMVSNAGPEAVSKVLDVTESQRVYPHSNEFDWGYGGSGPSQTALAILLDHTGDQAVAGKFYMDFKWDHVSGWDATWHISGKEIEAWLLKKRQETKGFTGCPTGHPGPAGNPGATSIQG